MALKIGGFMTFSATDIERGADLPSA